MRWTRFRVKDVPTGPSVQAKVSYQGSYRVSESKGEIHSDPFLFAYLRPDSMILHPSGSTCCPSRQGSGFNCCPLSRAVCCEGGLYCCPSGSTCNSKNGTCEYGTSRIRSSNGQESTSLTGTMTRTGNQVCPDKQHECSSDSTCCKISAHDYGCCPYERTSCFFDPIIAAASFRFTF